MSASLHESFERQTWRLILHPPAPASAAWYGHGAWNMAVDEALLESSANGAPPALRLYAWAPPCLSLGYAQPAADVDQDALAAQGWLLVRRPTGGRAILHTDELTYCVTAGHDEPRLAGSVLESYRRIAVALLHALHSLGIPAESSALAQPAPNADPKGAVCFETPSNYEITVGGKKLVGSAQARRKEGVLQHGAFPLTGDLKRITQALRFPDETARQAAAARVLQRAASAETALGAPLAWERAAAAFYAAFAETLNLEWASGALTPAEEQRAAEIMAARFANPDWTFKN